jgi:hypothetical protein
MSKCQQCGADEKSQRSSPDHRRFFGLIAAAFHHWPERHEFEPDDADHLRKWLLCKAGFRDVTIITVEYADDQPGLMKLVSLTAEAAVRAADNKAFTRVHGDKIVVFKAKSIAWDKLSQTAFNDVRDRVTAVIENELQLSADELLKQTEAAA